MVNLAFLAGGLMQGVGQGIVKQADDARAAAVEQYKVSANMMLQDRKIASEEGIARAHDAAEGTRSDNAIAGHHEDAKLSAAGEGLRAAMHDKTQKSIADDRNAAEKEVNDAKITADKPLKDAQANYYDKVKSHEQIADEEGYAMEVGPDGALKYRLTEEGKKIKLGKPGGSAKSSGGVVGEHIKNLRALHPDWDYQDALDYVKSNAKSDPQIAARLAEDARKDYAANPGTKKNPRTMDDAKASVMKSFQDNLAEIAKSRTSSKSAPGLTPFAAPPKGTFDEGAAPVAAPAPAPAVAAPAAPAPVAPTQELPPTAPPPAPVDPKKRVRGQTYLAADGKTPVIWDGTGFKRAVVNGP